MNTRDERANFEQLIERNTARLLDFAKPYVARLCNRDRGQLLEQALGRMWTLRRTYSRENESLLQYWDRCLRGAALTRRTWQVSTFDGKWVSVTGSRLGAEVEVVL